MAYDVTESDSISKLLHFYIGRVIGILTNPDGIYMQHYKDAMKLSENVNYWIFVKLKCLFQECT